ncbi:hypothetical protein AAEX28_14035 [Lentisphaerota bacterium WC36G]|nr:hypothetical protein LJT99_00785 [Lentisphaerae bacterium WC36]
MKNMFIKTNAVVLLLTSLFLLFVNNMFADEGVAQNVKEVRKVVYDSNISDEKMFMADFDKRGPYDFVQFGKKEHPYIWDVDWTVMQWGAYATFFKEPVNVYGLNFNFASSATHNMVGISLAGLDNSQTGANYGINMAYMIFGKRKNYFLSASIINVNYEPNYALMAALCLNYGYNKGLQAGAINVGEGVQAGGFNYSFNDDAVQFGGINITKSGWQFGLINYNEKAWLKCFPFFNYSSSDDDPF